MFGKGTSCGSEILTAGRSAAGPPQAMCRYRGESYSITVYTLVLHRRAPTWYSKFCALSVLLKSKTAVQVNSIRFRDIKGPNKRRFPLRFVRSLLCFIHPSSGKHTAYRTTHISIPVSDILIRSKDRGA